jgi:hypothetical protein
LTGRFDTDGHMGARRADALARSGLAGRRPALGYNAGTREIMKRLQQRRDLSAAVVAAMRRSTR